MLDVGQGFELIMNISMGILDIDGREVVLARVVLELLHEKHPQTRVGQLPTLKSCLLHTLAHLQEQCQAGLDRLDYIWVDNIWVDNIWLTFPVYHIDENKMVKMMYDKKKKMKKRLTDWFWSKPWYCFLT